MNPRISMLDLLNNLGRMTIEPRKMLMHLKYTLKSWRMERARIIEA